MSSRSNKEARSRGSSSPGSKGLGGAIKDAVNAVKSYRESQARSKAPVTREDRVKATGGGMVRKAAEKISGRQRQLDKAIDDAS